MSIGFRLEENGLSGTQGTFKFLVIGFGSTKESFADRELIGGFLYLFIYIRFPRKPNTLSLPDTFKLSRK